MLHPRRLHPRRAVAATVALCAALASTAGAAPLGNLVQLAGTSGCVSETGSGGSCADGVALDGANAASFTKNGLYLYVVAANSDAVAVFARQPASGALVQLAGSGACVSETGSGGACGDGKALDEPRDIAVSPDSKHVYVASTTSDGVAAFARDLTTGVLSQLSGTGACVTETGAGGCADGVALDGARSLAISANGKSLYVAARGSNAVAAFARDVKTGLLTQLAGTAACVSDNGSGGACVNGVALDFPTSVAVSPNGKNVYVTSTGSNAVAVFARNVTTGALTQLPGTAGCVSEDGSGGQCSDGRALEAPFSVAVSQNGKNVYVASRDSNAVAVFARDAKTGSLTQLAGSDGCVSESGGDGCADGNALTGAVSVTLTRNGKSLYVAAQGSDAVAAFARDLKTGKVTQLAGTDGCASESGSGGTCADGKALIEARNVVVSRNARNAYVTSETSDAIAEFVRE